MPYSNTPKLTLPLSKANDIVIETNTILINYESNFKEEFIDKERNNK